MKERNGSLEPRLSVLDFVSQLWRKIFLQSCETKSGMESLGSRLEERFTGQMVYITDNTDKLFLSREACVDLGIIPNTFPQ